MLKGSLERDTLRHAPSVSTRTSASGAPLSDRVGVAFFTKRCGDEQFSVVTGTFAVSSDLPSLCWTWAAFLISIWCCSRCSSSCNLKISKCFFNRGARLVALFLRFHLDVQAATGVPSPRSCSRLGHGVARRGLHHPARQVLRIQPKVEVLSVHRLCTVGTDSPLKTCWHER